MANEDGGSKCLIVNADDFGYCDRRNHGILESFQYGVVSSVSLLVNSVNALDAVHLAKTYGIPLGLHLNLTEGFPIKRHHKTLTSQRGFMRGKFGFREALKSGIIELDEIRAEVAAQLQWFIDNVGLLPTHIDGHQHVHVLPQVCESLTAIMKSSGIGWTRIPLELHFDRSVWIEESQKMFYKSVIEDAQNAKSAFAKSGISFSSHFIGFSIMGRNMTLERLLQALDKVFGSKHQYGSSLDSITKRNFVVCELMVHPGYKGIMGYGGCGEGTDWFSCSDDREHELSILKSPLLKEYLRTNNIKVCSFKHL